MRAKRTGLAIRKLDIEGEGFYGGYNPLLSPLQMLFDLLFDKNLKTCLVVIFIS